MPLLFGRMLGRRFFVLVFVQVGVGDVIVGASRSVGGGAIGRSLVGDVCVSEALMAILLACRADGSLPGAPRLALAAGQAAVGGGQMSAAEGLVRRARGRKWTGKTQGEVGLRCIDASPLGRRLSLVVHEADWLRGRRCAHGLTSHRSRRGAIHRCAETTGGGW
jgi:hypothetical protein